MEKRDLLFKYNLQFFADGDNDDATNGNDNSDQAGGENNTTGEGGNQTTGQQTQVEKTFTQKQVTSMMAKEKKQGKEAAFRELGIDPNNAQQMAMVKALVESQKTDEQKTVEQAAEQAAKIAEAEHRALVAEAKAEAMQLGIKPEFVDDAVTIALAKVDDKNDLKSVIGDMKTKYSVWFDNTEPDDKKNATGQSGTGSSIQNNSTGGNGGKKGSEGLGARLAAQRTQGPKKSFWD